MGGQGIGLLANALARACIAAGHVIHGCDTHGLAQRGGSVVSHLRLGKHCHTPRVGDGAADLVIGLERLEAFRGAALKLRSGGTLVYYDVVYQPIFVRLGRAPYQTADDFAQLIAARNGRVERVFLDGLEDPRTQNAALLGRVASLGVIPGLTKEHVADALSASLPAAAREQNLEVFRRAAI